MRMVFLRISVCVCGRWPFSESGLVSGAVGDAAKVGASHMAASRPQRRRFLT